MVLETGANIMIELVRQSFIDLSKFLAGTQNNFKSAFR
jgi:hypothetical protein